MRETILKVLLTTLTTAMVFGSTGQILKLDKSSVDSKYHQELEAFISEIDEVIPDSVRQAINEDIEIKFMNFKENEKFSVLPANRCKDAGGIVYGRVSYFNRDTIKVSKLFVNEILKGEEGAQKFNCGHGDYYRKAKATILHELAHVYDLKKVRTKEHKAEARVCRRKKEEKRPIGLKCKAVLSQDRNKKSISGLYSFYKLSNWKKGFFNKSAKNLSTKRSADAYEYENLDEHNAVNFEYFLMDKNYKCKRPTYYKFYSNLLGHHPFEDNNCQINTEIVLDDLKVTRDIDPKKVYRIDYLLASKGDSMISGFGHSMYRIVLCAPFRTEVSEKCLRDKMYHVVLSYRANVTDLKSDTIKGILGGYDSVLFMLSQLEVENEYNGGELRDLISQPLHLNEEQKTDFINKVLEVYWEYEGDYKFITNNCASESNELLQAAMPNHEFTYERIILPYSLKDKINEMNLSSESYYDDLDIAQQKGMYIPSDIDLLKHVKKSLFGDELSDYKIYRRRTNHGNKGFKKFKKVKREKFIKDILEEFDTERLYGKFEELREMEVSKLKERKLKDLSIMADAIFKIKQAVIDEEVGDFLDKNMENDTNLGARIKQWNDLRKSSRVKPEDFDYGIPLVVKDSDFETHNERNVKLENVENELLEDIKSNYQDQVVELARLLNLIRTVRDESRLAAIELFNN